MEGLSPEQRSRRARRNGTLAVLKAPAPLLPKACPPVYLSHLRESADGSGEMPTATPAAANGLLKKDYSKWLGNAGPRRHGGSAVRFFDEKDRTQAGLEKASFGGGMAADREIRRHSFEARFGVPPKRPITSQSAKNRVDFQVTQTPWGSTPCGVPACVYSKRPQSDSLPLVCFPFSVPGATGSGRGLFS